MSYNIRQLALIQKRLGEGLKSRTSAEFREVLDDAIIMLSVTVNHGHGWRGLLKEADATGVALDADLPDSIAEIFQRTAERR